MKTNYFLVLDKLLCKLSREFNIPTPELVSGCPTNLSGCYYCGEIHIAEDVLHNLHEAVKTLKHEFAHYLQDYLGLTKRTEIQAKRFEKNMFVLGRLPHSQTLISSFGSSGRGGGAEEGE